MEHTLTEIGTAFLFRLPTFAIAKLELLIGISAESAARRFLTPHPASPGPDSLDKSPNADERIATLSLSVPVAQKSSLGDLLKHLVKDKPVATLALLFSAPCMPEPSLGDLLRLNAAATCFAKQELGRWRDCSPDRRGAGPAESRGERRRDEWRTDRDRRERESEAELRWEVRGGRMAIAEEEEEETIKTEESFRAQSLERIWRLLKTQERSDESCCCIEENRRGNEQPLCDPSKMSSVEFSRWITSV